MSVIPMLGIYLHYKNKQRYELLGYAQHTETLEELVIYKALYGEQGVWARPKKMFFEAVAFEGGWVPRFKLEE